MVIIHHILKLQVVVDESSLVHLLKLGEQRQTHVQDSRLVEAFVSREISVIPLHDDIRQKLHFVGKITILIDSMLKNRGSHFDPIHNLDLLREFGVVLLDFDC